MGKPITQEALNKEYIEWTSKYGNGRNEKDLRFGQYIHITYNIQHLFDPINSGDGFYTENAAEAFRIISNKIY